MQIRPPVKKDLKQTHWKDIWIEAYLSQAVTLSFPACGPIHGRECGYRIREAEKPLIVRLPDGREKKLSDVGYSWYHFAPEGHYFWLSAAFDPEGTLLELYFDLTAGSDFSDPENPCFLDLYLDVVLTPEKEIRILDREELDEALRAGFLGASEYERTLRNGDALTDYLKQNAEAVLQLVKARMAKLNEIRKRTGEGSLGK